MTTYEGRDALIEASVNGSLAGTMVATVTLVWGAGSRDFTTVIHQSEPGDDVIALNIEGQQVPLFSDTYNNLTIHTFLRLTIEATR